MAYATGTTHYNLPQTVGTDKRDWFDTNQAFSDVDSALYSAVSAASTQESEIQGLDTRLTAAEGNISDNSADITALDTRLTTAEGSITTQSSQIEDVRSDAEDMICAYNEPTATSTHAYVVDDYFIYNDVLYKATANIGIGDTIVPDTNCTTTNVTTEIATAVATAGDEAIDMICAVVENTTTATRNYSAGDYFIFNNILYRVTATITVGTTIIPNTNCVSTTTSDELSELNSNYAKLSTWNLFQTFNGDVESNAIPADCIDCLVYVGYSGFDVAVPIILAKTDNSSPLQYRAGAMYSASLGIGVTMEYDWTTRKIKLSSFYANTSSVSLSSVIMQIYTR